MKSRKRGRCAAFVALVLVAVWMVEAPVCQAEVTKEYYLIVDDMYSYPLSETLYGQIYELMNGDSAEPILELLRLAYGVDKVPEQASRMVLRVYTYDRTETGGVEEKPDDSMQGGMGQEAGLADTENPDFDILAGRLMRYHGRDKVVTIPDSVKYISQGAFYGNHTVEKIIVPASVTMIDNYSFFDCGRLKYIVFAGKGKTIGSRMIYKCDKLASIVAPKQSKEWKYAEKEGIKTFTADRPSFGEKTLRLLAGDKRKLVLYNTLDKIQWKSSAKSIVSVSSDGTITCRKKGTATITAVVANQPYRIAVQVSEKSEEKRIQQVIRTSIKKGMSTREKVKAIHDWLIRNVKYDYYNYLRGTVPKVSHTSQGALLRGIAVCDGYSKAMNKILKRLGIPCEMVIGTYDGAGHAWNRVKVNGTWLHVDTTFDDPIVNGKNTNTKPYYTYFLKTAKQMRKDHHF